MNKQGSEKKSKKQQAQRKLLAGKLAIESKLVAKESIKVLKKFEQIGYVEWWEDKEFIAELDRRHKAMESGEDKGVTLEQLQASIELLRQKLYPLPD